MEDPANAKVLKVFVAVLIVAMCSTVYHIVSSSKNRFWTSFSLIRNVKSLFCVGNGFRLDALDGIRVFAMAYIVAFHIKVYAGIHRDNYNPSYAKEMETEWWYKLLFAGQMSVDTFLVVGGLVLSLKFMRKLDQK